MYKQQNGAVLLTTLVMLLVILLLGVQIAVQSDVNKVLVSNEEQRQITEQYAQNIANEVLSDVDHFLTPASALTKTANPKLNASFDTTDNVWTTQYEGYDVSFTSPDCVRSKEVDGYSFSATVAPWTNYYVYTVTVSDPVTGASTTIDVGAKFNYTAGNCT